MTITCEARTFLKRYVRDWSLIKGRGGYKTGGGPVRFYPYKKGEGREKFC